MRAWTRVLVAIAVTMEMGVVATMSKVELVNNGYEGVVVGVSSRVDSSMASEIIASLKKMLKEGSKAMLKATRNRAYLRDVTIMVPPSWTHVDEEDPEEAVFLKQEESDIRVDVPDSVYRDQPYTLQTGVCGAPGLYIHYTPAYLTDDELVRWWGARGTSLVYEWAKLRWGVFDELGYPGDPKYPAYYRSGRHGDSVVPTMCGPKVLEGEWKDEKEDECPKSPDGAPAGSCYFTASNCSSVSLMSFYSCHTPNLEFCDKKTHNSEAPTKHNRLCNHLSVWQVMEHHRDFASGANPPLNSTAAQEVPEPRVRVVRERPPAIAMVIDVSGSMTSHRRSARLKRAVSWWILRDAPDNTSLAILVFSDDVKVVQNLTQLDSEATRRALAASLNHRPMGGTSIGSGLLKAIEVLKDETSKLIFLVTDGEENEKPYIRDMMGDLLSSGARLITLGIGMDADPQLHNLTKETSGASFHFLDESYSFDIEYSLEAIQDFMPSVTKSSVLYRKTFLNVSQMTMLKDQFFVDCCPSKMDVIIDMESGINQYNPKLKNPNGQAVIGRFEDLLQAWVFDVSEPETGKWVWSVMVERGARSVRASVKVQTDDSSSISVRNWRSSSPTQKEIIFMTELKKGECPILHARISININDINSSDMVSTTLHDDGEHSDLLSGDGIYSGSLKNSNGIFILATRIDGMNATISCPVSSEARRRRRQTRLRPTYCCGSTVTTAADSVPTGTFNRSSSSGSIEITDVPSKGSLPPSPVRDLQVSALTPNTYQLSWTATGDDLDDGVVSEYELLLLDSWTGRAKAFENVRPIKLSDVLEGDFDTQVLLEAGSKIVVNVSLNLDRKNYLAIRAVDAKGNRGNVSAAVTLNFIGSTASVTTIGSSASVTTTGSTASVTTIGSSASVTTIGSSASVTTIGSTASVTTTGINNNNSRNTAGNSTKMVVIILLVTLCLVTIAVFCSVHYCRRKTNWRPKL
ncbi:calcium-activated chloride channel regulator 1-like [Penaeus chinensis]|uniref:calcium-activated chloride channel regulator 1-like n=1 Tax=Penaeus chinensis TaxID=139456 RepID=UPI001FB77ACA|nr:calcium-activated chloride channel regulator 1-like [Penaeus chinensis]XP_047486113.1 calcium-activated chloride channel regulator 1-like [Penaeus chinensis]XP_047486114.1 calcium-activated chloride channel regulator 1-like [Penaeus chinensis]XP_047486115.1 calcium-activated chloride channel regulator 1-like [Penaeus chinensis]